VAQIHKQKSEGGQDGQGVQDGHVDREGGHLPESQRYSAGNADIPTNSEGGAM
jgi:hypothetical protein